MRCQIGVRYERANNCMDHLGSVRAGFESARRQIAYMLQQSSDELNRMTQEALDAEMERFFKQDNLDRMIRDMARHRVQSAVEGAVKDYFAYGPGGQTIKKAAFEILDEMFSTK